MDRPVTSGGITRPIVDRAMLTPIVAETGPLPQSVGEFSRHRAWIATSTGPASPISHARISGHDVAKDTTSIKASG